MGKAYDMVEWHFLKTVMEKLDFGERWIQLLILCVKSTTYSILINGKPKGCIKPSRSLRQGDLLSLYLFPFTQMQQLITNFQVFRYIGELLPLVISFLQILVFFPVKKNCEKIKLFIICWDYLRELRDNKSIEPRLLSRLV